MASITKRSTAAGQARYDVRWRTPAGEARKQTRRTLRAAERLARDVETEKDRGTYIDPRRARMTLEEWWERWWPSTANLRRSTRARDESYWRHRVKPALGDVPLQSIDRALLRAWVAELIAAELAPATIHKYAQIVSKALDAAVDDGRLVRNPAARLDLPRIKRGDPRFLTPADVDELTAAIDTRFGALVVLGAYGGLRLGEMLGLRRARVDLLRRRVDVAVTLVAVRGELIENEPKTRAGRRAVPLPRVAVDALDEHLLAYPGGPDELVFTAAEGGPVRAELWRRRVWQPACIATGLGELVKVDGRTHYRGLRPHDLRHTAVSFWIAAGASPREIAARAGHSSVVTVLDRYGHLLPGTEDVVNDALDELAENARRDRARHGRAMEVAELSPAAGTQAT